MNPERHDLSDGYRWLNRLLERFQEVVESAHQISTAAQEQTAGAKQVAGAIGSIDGMMLASLKELRNLKKHLDAYRELARDLDQAFGGDDGPERRGA